MPPSDTAPQSVIRVQGKVCNRCRCTRERDDFYRDSSMAEGILNICKKCKRIEHAEYKRTHASEIKEYFQEYWRSRRGTRKNVYATNPDYRKKAKEYARLHRRQTNTPRPEKNLQRRSSRYAVARALKVGVLHRLPCIVCANPGSHAHHQDYSSALKVVWLCPVHHKELHSKYTEDIVTPILRSLRVEFDEVNRAAIR